MYLNENKISGYESRDKFILIFDERGTPFYFFKNRKNKIRFNLPAGNYSTANTLKKVSPIVWNLPPLPKKEKNNSLPEKIKVTVGNNIHKASIWIEQNKILLDERYTQKDFPEFIRKFIMLHEVGHYFYSSEYKCDLFAKDFMLRNGYNKSQVALASFLSLCGVKRRSDLIKHIKKISYE